MQQALWTRPPASPVLDVDAVHVWRVTLAMPAAHVGALEQVLSDDERVRAERFHFVPGRAGYVVSRAALRHTLARYVRRAPAELRFTYHGRGKPGLHVGPTERLIEFNLAHSGSFALIAVTEGRRIGVDIELHRTQFDGRALAERFFSTRERAVLSALPSDQQQQGFFDCWTRKEAYIKAKGEGLAIPLDSFDVTLAPGEPSALLDVRDAREDPARWTLRAVEVAAGYSAAVAVNGAIEQLCCWEWAAPL